MTDKTNPLIWVVDDSPTCRARVSGKLHEAGYNNVRLFDGKNSGGQEVIDELNTGKKPDLIVTDNDMPVMSGISVLKAAKEHDVKAMMLSATIDGSIELQAQNLGAEFYQKNDYGTFIKAVNRLAPLDASIDTHTQSSHPVYKTTQQLEKL